MIETRSTSLRRVFAVAVVLAIVTTLAAAPATAQDDPRTGDEFLEEFRELEGEPAYEEYSEFEVIRSQAVSEVQVGEFDADDRHQMSLLLEALRSFSAAYASAENDSATESLEWANQTGVALDDLRRAGGTRYVALGGLALDRFYEDLGEEFHDQANGAESTPRKLALLSQSAQAYKQAGAASRFSELTIQADRLRTEYETDERRLDEALATAEPILADCPECTDPADALSARGPGVFEAYAATVTAERETTVALALAEKHGLADRTEEIADLDGQAEESVVSLGIASAMVAMTYAIVVAAIAGAVAYRIEGWRRDYEDSHVGEIVLAGEVVHG